ncbi:MAG TPA: UvrD-helicase domain-containing protein [Patescibacteria group bacterium]
MEQMSKDTLLQESRTHVQSVQKAITQEIADMEQKVVSGEEEWRSQSADDRVIFDTFLAHYQERKGELGQLYPSPYFVRCDVLFEGESEIKTYYFAKFPFSEEQIYSWTVPAATLRYEEPGEVNYTALDGTVYHGTLVRKDQYMIVDGNVVFFASETAGRPRELIYQEHFSTRKSGFVLPEIVAQMEKAQDQVVRAAHQGPFVISGPAGSGKTTLAFHRVAYLMQSPDTASLYPSDSILILVQDTGTRDYFTHLLPELGIKQVAITTFFEWAVGVLELTGFEATKWSDLPEPSRDSYEYAKLKALREFVARPKKGTVYSWLEEAYASCFFPHHEILWQQQIKSRKLDRIDITLLLMAQNAEAGGLTHMVETFVKQRNGTYKRKFERQPIRYNLMVVDEFQNYLPEQLTLLQGCRNPRLESTIYVGDMAQQVQLGTVKNWEEAREKIETDRMIVLAKVYRNTQRILEFIRSLGYEVHIPEKIRIGDPVAEVLVESVEEEVAYIEDLLTRDTQGSLGVIAKDSAYLAPFRTAFRGRDRVHIVTMQESQGVEFDRVCLVGITPELLTSHVFEEAIRKEKRHIDRDLLYVALTRAMSEMHVLGNCYLRESIQFLDSSVVT